LWCLSAAQAQCACYSDDHFGTLVILGSLPNANDETLLPMPALLCMLLVL
jgi:hypothetical protein